MEDDFFLPLLITDIKENTDDEFREAETNGLLHNAANTDVENGPKFENGKEDSISDRVSSSPERTPDVSAKLDASDDKLQFQLAVSKILKKGRVFETQRKSRRVNVLRRKKGTDNELAKNERKIKRILEDLEAFKYISFGTLVGAIVDCVSLEEDSLDLALAKAVERCESSETLKQDLPDEQIVTENVYLKFINSGNIRTNLIELGSKYRSGQLIVKVGKDDKKSDGGENLIESPSPAVVEKRSKQKNKGKIIGKSKKLPERKQKTTAEDIKDKVDEQNSSELVNCLENVDQVARSEIVEINENISKLPLEKEKTNNTNANGRRKERRTNSRKASKESTGLERKKGDGNIQKRKNFIAELKKKGNRLGQRARRELWEKMYGTQADHIKHNLPFRGSIKKVQTKQSRHPVKNATTTDGRSFKNAQVTQPIEDMKNLHPSWQAKKLQKNQSSIVVFEGSKVRFDD